MSLWSFPLVTPQVHNLALYPERHSWCTPTPIRQEISAHVTECQPLTIDNVVCLGACFSYSVPRAQGDAVIPPYCDACRPTISAWTAVSLLYILLIISISVMNLNLQSKICILT